ncbi:MAG: hypothetical protein KGQ59_09305, partial [Bdellovibrionales bacterium]|nr:hypothetical protein [Bdellovibrionales bacterium]
MSQQRDRYYLDIEKIRAFLPHRSPFLLVDRILDIQPKGDLSRFDLSNGADKLGTKVVGLKNFTFNEPFIPGHFPGYSIVPGVIQIETMAQVASFALYPFFEGHPEMKRGFQCILVGVDAARFRRPVIPGDALRVEAELTKARGKIWGFHVEGFVDGQRAVEADIL